MITSSFNLSPPTNPPAVCKRGTIHLPSKSCFDFMSLKGAENLEFKMVLLFSLSRELLLENVR